MTKKWFIARESKQFGPFTLDQLRTFAESRRITTDEAIWCEGMADWAPAHTIAGLFADRKDGGHVVVPAQQAERQGHVQPATGAGDINVDGVRHRTHRKSSATRGGGRATEANDGVPVWVWAMVGVTTLALIGLGTLMARSVIDSNRKAAIAKADADFTRRLKQAQIVLERGDYSSAEKAAADAMAIPGISRAVDGRTFLDSVNAKRSVAEAEAKIKAGNFTDAQTILERAASAGDSGDAIRPVIALLDQLLSATSMERATKFAEQLSDDELAACLRSGALPPAKRPANSTLNQQLIATLQKAIPAIQESRRAANIVRARNERAQQRQARVGQTLATMKPEGSKAVMSGDRRFMASVGSNPSRVIVRSIESGDLVAALESPRHLTLDEFSSKSALSSDGALAAATARTAEGRWDVVLSQVSTKELRGVFEIPRMFVAALAVTDQYVFVAMGNDIFVVDHRLGGAARQLSGHSEKVTALATHPGRGLLASGGDDNKVIIWELSSGRQISMLRGHVSVIQDMVFTPDGLKVVSGGFDCSVRLWNLADGRLEREWQLGRFDAAAEARLRAQDSDNQRQARVNDLTGRSTVTPPSPMLKWTGPRIRTVDTSPDGTRIVAGLHAPEAADLVHSTNPVLLDIVTGEVVPLPEAFKVDPYKTVAYPRQSLAEAFFVRDGDAIMFGLGSSFRIVGAP